MPPEPAGGTVAVVPVVSCLEMPSALSLVTTFITCSPQRLPPFLGSAVHGALSRAVYRTVCVFPRRPTCAGCPLLARCAYPLLFDTPAPADDTLLAAGIRDQAPRPLVVGPEPGWTRPSGHPVRLDADAEIPVRLTLVGRAIDELPIVVVALQRLARRGLGLPAEEPADPAERMARPALRLARVTTADGSHVVYDGATDTYEAPIVAPAGSAGAEEPPQAAVIEFITPLRLKRDGKLIDTVPPPVFIATLARRANALSVLFGSGTPAVDEAECERLATGIAVAAAELRRVHVTRYSARQRQRMSWPGLMGSVHWRGPALRTLWPLLRFGEQVQVGKGTALGFGRYRLGMAAAQPRMIGKEERWRAQ
ncbi:CRISPR system precrRNA processing endoribonuclease RAMP protein Cas6 [Candidatus Binatia bacterium]|nr:CRISPR system precrRNA processing endoribonuclease RAMP protein Cas6 [Candidatus Binatia bacterium]